MKRLDIEKMKSFASQKRGLCLSEEYINNSTPLIWQCAQGHIWEARPGNILYGKWCRKCKTKENSLKKMNSIEKYQNKAKERGGKLLSKDYLGNNIKHTWQCSKGHVWEATPGSILYTNNWCPYCSGRRKSIDLFRKLAIEKGGKCLSSEFKNVFIKLRWQCAYGHIWEAVPRSIEKGSWCPECKLIKLREKASDKRISINLIREIAKERGGELLSNEYERVTQKLKWRCKEGHVFEANLHQIKSSGSWCPVCTTNISERICKDFFEFIFSAPFPKKRPSWLINSRGNIMELDGYNEELGIAFEYQGRQHYKKIDFFHKNEDSLKKRIEDDSLKKVLCANRGIVLIDVPYSVAFDEMQTFILKELKNNDILVKNKSLVDFRLLDSYAPNRIYELKKIAQNRGGELLSTKYHNAHIKLEWKCARGHVWTAPPNRVKRGSWCKKCSTIDNVIKMEEKRLIELRELAISRGGKCLSDKYTSSEKQIWQCAQGHIWKAVSYSVKSGSWCPFCSLKKRGLKSLNLKR